VPLRYRLDLIRLDFGEQQFDVGSRQNRRRQNFRLRLPSRAVPLAAVRALWSVLFAHLDCPCLKLIAASFADPKKNLHVTTTRLLARRVLQDLTPLPRAPVAGRAFYWLALPPGGSLYGQLAFCIYFQDFPEIAPGRRF
jgi:hypothetical protein